MSIASDLPNDIEACHALIQTQFEATESLAKDNAVLRNEIEELKRYIYGRRSERHAEDPSQLTLFDPPVAEKSIAEAEEPAEEEITYRRRQRAKAARFPENLPRKVHTLDVPADERNCSCCGDEMPVLETDIRQRLEYVPAKMMVHELHHIKRACSKCDGTVKAAPPPPADHPAASLTKGSRYGFGVTNQIILGKFADHLPLYRLEDVFARAGVVIPRSSQVDLLDRAADLITPLTELMKSRVLDSPVIGLDDTPIRLQDASLPGKMRTARMWLARGRELAPYNVFFFHQSRERDGPAKFLGDFEGTVTVDAYGVNDGVYLGKKDRIEASCCHAHVRRKFEAAKSNDPKRAVVALAFYRRLFDIEDRVAERSDDERLAVRVAESLPLCNEFEGWLHEQKADFRVLPKSAIGKAIGYAINQWKPLLSPMRDGRLPIHNNDTERDLRKLTIGRKNWLFVGSSIAGSVSAQLYSLVASATRHNLDHWTYLDDVLRSLAGGEQDIARLLPDAWAKAHPESIRTYRQTESLARAAKTKARRALRRRQKSS